jgi:hypothetical protein
MRQTVHCRAYKNPPLVHIFGQMNPHKTQFYLLIPILILSFHSTSMSSSGLFLKPLCTPLLSYSQRATWHAHQNRIAQVE